MSRRTAFLVSLLIVVPGALPAQENGAAGAEEPGGVEDAAWLAGCWEAASPDGSRSVEEMWAAPRGGLMLGLSRSVRGGVVRGHEFLTLREIEGRLVYHAVPSGQSPTDFEARSVDRNRLEFVNAEHDFPQKIVYRRTGADSVHAEVFGEVDGTEPAFALPYGRVACPGL